MIRLSGGTSIHWSGMKYSVLLFIMTVLYVPSYGSEQGLASWYGGKFHGRRTANGEVYDMNRLSAAHLSLTFGTLVKVTNLDNGMFTIVRINDRGPFVTGRIIDLSRAAAEEIGMIGSGIAMVRLDVLTGEEEGGPTYVIQVGAYREKGNADRVTALLEKAGLNVRLEETDDGIVRVLVGDVNFGVLEEVKGTLKELGFESVLVRTAAAEQSDGLFHNFFRGREQ